MARIQENARQMLGWAQVQICLAPKPVIAVARGQGGGQFVHDFTDLGLGQVVGRGQDDVVALLAVDAAAPGVADQARAPWPPRGARARSCGRGREGALVSRSATSLQALGTGRGRGYLRYGGAGRRPRSGAPAAGRPSCGRSAAAPPPRSRPGPPGPRRRKRVWPE